MKIIGINKIDNKLAITLDQNFGIYADNVYLFLDNVDNFLKRSSDKPTDHTYSKIIIQENEVLVELSEDQRTFFIPLSEIEQIIDPSAFIANLHISPSEVYAAFYYDEEELYYKQIELLCGFCSTCLDDQQQDRIMLFNLKYRLLEYAVYNNMIDDAVNHYKDIARMLGITTSSSVICGGGKKCVSCQKAKCNSCCGCKNGCCSLC